MPEVTLKRYPHNEYRERQLARINAVKPLLPHRYTDIVIRHLPQYNSVRGCNRIYNMIRKGTGISDEVLIVLEKITGVETHQSV